MGFTQKTRLNPPEGLWQFRLRLWKIYTFMKLMKTKYWKIKAIVLLLIISIIQLVAAILNGFPIVYSDTSTYIASGFGFETPFDRPITYGLFLWLTSMSGISLWLVIFTQSFILAYLVFLFFKKFVDPENPGLLSIISIGIVSLFSSLSWTSSQLMPDVFTPALLFCLVIIVAGKNSKKEKGILYFILLLSCGMHFSHVMFAVLLAIILLILKFFLRKRNFISASWLTLGLIIVLAGASILSMGSALAKSKHVFFMGAMIEHGITQEYLDEFCPEKNYKLCIYKDSLPEKAWQFIWDEKSPLYNMGEWKDSKKEFNEIISGTLTNPKYIWLHIKASFIATAQQLIMFKIGDGNGAFPSGTKLHERVNEYFPHEMGWYENSKQNKEQLFFISFFNSLIYVVTVISVFIIIGLCVMKKVFQDDFLLVFIIFILGIVLNAWINGTFANAIDRLGTKMIWIIPFLAIVGVYKSFFRKPLLAQ